MQPTFFNLVEFLMVIPFALFDKTSQGLLSMPQLVHSGILV